MGVCGAVFPSHQVWSFLVSAISRHNGINDGALRRCMRPIPSRWSVFWRELPCESRGIGVSCAPGVHRMTGAMDRSNGQEQWAEGFRQWLAALVVSEGFVCQSLLMCQQDCGRTGYGLYPAVPGYAARDSGQWVGSLLLEGVQRYG